MRQQNKYIDDVPDPQKVSKDLHYILKTTKCKFDKVFTEYKKGNFHITVSTTNVSPELDEIVSYFSNTYPEYTYHILDSKITTLNNN